MSDCDRDTHSLLEETQHIVEDRENRHGSIVESHRAIAGFWSTYLTSITGHEIELDPSHAADMLDLFKDARKATGERDRDTYRDAIGYNYCAWTCREHEHDTE